MAGMDQIDSFRSCSPLWSSIISCRGAEADSQSLAVQQTIVLPRLQFSDKVQVSVVARCVQRQVPSIAAAHLQGRHHPFRGAEAYPMIKLFTRP